jgi:eukaryotic-like serine/threonine-protein kinase
MSRTKFFVPSADRRLGERYELIECLGDGSHGWVWKAHRLSDNAIVALKIPKDQGSTNSELEEGALLVNTPPHSNVVAINWMGRVPPEREWFVIEMEYFPSRTLAQVFEDKETTFAASYASIFATYQQVLQGVAYLHELGMAHGDIKPHNILVSGEQTKVTDFGSSLQPEEMYVRSRENGGTILYSAPEMLGILGPGRRKSDPFLADIYSLGVLLYFLLTSRLPHETSSQVERHTPFPRPREINSSICPAVEHFVLRCLAERPEDRWPAVADMLTEVSNLRRLQLEYSVVSGQKAAAARSADWSVEVISNFEKQDYSAAEVAAHRQFEAAKDAYAFLLMVQAAARDGRHFDCLKYLERFPAFSRPPGKYADQLRVIGVDAYVAVRKIDAAELLVNELVQEGKADRVLLIKKASILGVQARFDEARELLFELNRKYPNDRLILKKLVLVNEQLRDSSKAAAYLRAYCATGESDTWANRKLQEFSALGLM